MVLTATDDNNTLKANTNAAAVDTVQPNGTTFSLKEAVSTQGNVRIGYLKFDASLASAAVDGDLAQLSVTSSGATTTSFDITIYALNQGVTGYDWTETTLTWNNSPANSSSSATNYLNTASLTNVGSFTIANASAAGASFGVSFSSWESYRQVDGTLTFIVVVTDQANQSPTLGIASSEHATESWRPTLSIVPEPGTFLLAGPGMLALLRRRRA